MAGFYMCRFKAVNILTLLLPGGDGTINIIKKLDTLPPDFDDLPWIHERSDKKYSGHLEIRDTVILLIEMAGFQEIYQISCEMVESEGKTDIFVVTLSRGYN